MEQSFKHNKPGTWDSSRNHVGVRNALSPPLRVEELYSPAECL